jgi:hypothetical protein
MRRLIAIALMGVVSSAAAPAPGTCGPWVPQTDGSQWRMCADAQSRTYCEMKQGSSVLRIDCPS